MNKLLELADRCERATGPVRELDIRIAKAVGRYGSVVLGSESVRFTHSIDAAMTLVPEGWWLQHLGHKLDGWACLIETIGPPSHSSDVGRRNGIASAALALSAAALRALAHQTAEERDNG